MFTESSDFLSTGISALLAGNEKLHVLFATYNTVNGYDSGAVQTNKDGLTIQVQNGNLQYSPITLLVGFIGTPLADIGGKAMDQEARAAQANLDHELMIEQPREAALVAIVYAGLSAFDEAVSMARSLKHETPNAKVVITTCDCMLNDKTRTLRPMLERKEIEGVVITDCCGGRETMRDILERLIEVWPTKVTA